MNLDLPPPNRAIGWYRLMLWMMPTVIFYTTAIGLSLLGWGWAVRHGRLSYGMPICILVTLVSAIVTGILEARLSYQQRRVTPGSRRANVAVDTFHFVAAQVFIIPAIGFLYVMFAGLIFTALAVLITLWV